jgi:hypothetical protein
VGVVYDPSLQARLDRLERAIAGLAWAQFHDSSSPSELRRMGQRALADIVEDVNRRLNESPSGHSG